MKSRVEHIIIVVLVTVAFYSITIPKLQPVFMGAFNSVDGSIYLARFVDITIALLIIFSVSLRLIPRQIALRKPVLLLIWSIGILILVSLVEYQLDRVILKLFNLPTSPNQFSDKMLQYRHRISYDIGILAGNTMVLVFAFLYGISRDWLKRYRQQNQLQQEKLKADVAFLRTQINPHFFFNSLNNIYAITQRNNDSEGGQAIMKLAGMMRYMIYESDSERVPLLKEVELLNNYIQVAQLKYRTDDPLTVNFNSTGIKNRQQIAPLILLPFVENAFKHGISSKGKGNITINIDVIDEQLNLLVENSVFPVKPEFKSRPGIGLTNVKQRLNLLYTNKFSLSIDKSDDLHRVELTIQLASSP